MQRIYQNIFFIVFVFLFGSAALAQNNPDTSKQAKVDQQLLDLLNSKVPKEYVISEINVTGTKSFDANLIISISGLAVGDKVQIPGTDLFSKAISKLWRQNLISNVTIYLTKVIGQNLSIEIAVTE